MGIYNLVSFTGIFILLLFAWLLSSDRRKVNWRVIIWGISIQLIIAVFIFIVPIGSRVFILVNDIVVKILNSATAGAKFVFGPLALAPGETGDSGEKSLGFILAFQSFPTIIFFSALISILYYFNIMQRVIRGFAYFFTKLMRISGAESLVAASEIFVGIESNMAVRPYLNKMTRSEICTIMTCGMATVASNVLALYVFSLRDIFPTIAGHLVTASLLSAPAAVVMSKIILPEGERPETLGIDIKPSYDKENSFFEAIINGANAGVRMIVGIVALLIAVLGLVALADLIISLSGVPVNKILGLEGTWSLKAVFSYIFYPFTLICGVHPADAKIISGIIGERIIVTEVVAYKDLAAIMKEGLLQNPRSAVIATYALCGFAHLASMGIYAGGLAALAPGRSSVIAKVALRALIAATLAGLLTACVAGAVFSQGQTVLGF
jgi:CNT family concentrative nucleoside transporter